jgi:putative transposase
MDFYNYRRPHQAMKNQFPMAVWRAGMDQIEVKKSVDMPLRLDNANALPHIHSRGKRSGRRLQVF